MPRANTPNCYVIAGSNDAMKTARHPKNSMTRKALTALHEAVAQVVAEHRRDGRPLAIWQDGKAMLVAPDKPSVVRETPSTYRTNRKSQEKSRA